ncbi:hypothetical protein EV191_110207 [Tamaricihabitans halophyticus]|uniref:TrbL/VirB6 plasmid conjugal transfer protein n=1 Tax=Tamaricihabitans halophyticus TaxID=1262583 RepID=A0A4V2SSZ3_9PSEU|nr:magnesium transporter [Tamaricihabitans halophyticus]TCP48646.1 hypothetical protein EV191_110207 [Tamaricihabitans halophyticus]
MGVLTTITLLAVVAVVLRRAARRRAKPSVHRARSARRPVLLLIIGIIGTQLTLAPPAVAQDCAEAPNPERPGTGLVGALDPAEGNGEDGSAYIDYGYAGMVWHVYDDSCMLASSITDPSSTMDTWAGNQLFNVAKTIVGATNSLHYTVMEGGLLNPLYDAVASGAEKVYSNVFMQLFGIAALLLALLLFRHIWRGNLPAISRKTLFALAGLWLAASSFTLLRYYDEIDRAIVQGTTNIQAGFVEDSNDRLTRDILPTNLHNRVVYDNWLRGEFGAPDAPQAEEHGRDLLDAQAYTWAEVRNGDDADQAVMDGKKEDYKQIAGQLGPATGYFTGEDGSRTGAGFLAMFQSFVYSLFQLFAKAVVLFAQVMVRLLTLAAPLIGLVALLHHDILRKVGRIAGAVVLNLVVLSVLAGIHALLLQAIFAASGALSLLTQMALAAIVTIVFFMVGRPMRRMWQMVELSVGAMGSALPNAGQGLFSRFRRRGKDSAPTPQDEFWNGVRGSDDTEQASGPAGRGRRVRPEASNPVTVSAQRMDDTTGRPLRPDGRATVLPNTGTYGAAALPAAGRHRAAADHLVPGTAQSGETGATVNRVSQPSRRVDTVPVSDRSWDRDDDPVIVPSRLAAEAPAQPVRDGQVPAYANASPDRPVAAAAPSTPTPRAEPAMQPRPPRVPMRRADPEVVAGRPATVVYRPSRGLEVRDERDTDAIMR